MLNQLFLVIMLQAACLLTQPCVLTTVLDGMYSGSLPRVLAHEVSLVSSTCNIQTFDTSGRNNPIACGVMGPSCTQPLPGQFLCDYTSNSGIVTLVHNTLQGASWKFLEPCNNQMPFPMKNCYVCEFNQADLQAVILVGSL